MAHVMMVAVTGKCMVLLASRLFYQQLTWCSCTMVFLWICFGNSCSQIKFVPQLLTDLEVTHVGL